MRDVRRELEWLEDRAPEASPLTTSATRVVPGTPEPLFTANVNQNKSIHNHFAVTRDGQRFLFLSLIDRDASPFVTVLTLAAGMGEKWDDAAMKTFTAGAFARMPKKSPHYGHAKEETIVQVHGTGPFTLTYVNPDDDPRKKETR